MAGSSNFVRSTWSIAVYTWREGIRKKTLVGFLILSMLVIFGASFMSAFLDPATIGDVESDIDFKLIKDICVTTISIFGILITIFISASVIPSEVDNRVIYTILSKPISRFQYLLGKFVGVQLIVLVNLLLMGFLFIMALYARQPDVFPTLMIWSVVLTYFEFLIVSALTFALSATSTSAVLPTIGGLFIYITGNLTEYLQDVSNRSGQSGEMVDTLIGYIALGLYYVLPNLQDFSLKMHILNLPLNNPPTGVLIPNLIFLSLLYCVSGFCITYIIFRRKEF